MIASFARRAPFAARSMFGVALLFAGTEQAAHQDLSNLFVQQPGVAERARNFMQIGSFAALKTATFSLPNPLGAAIPKLPIPDHFEIIRASLPGERALALEPAPEPKVQREGKADRLVPSAPPILRTLESRLADDVPFDAEAAIEESSFLAVVDSEPFDGTPDFAGTIARAVEAVPAAGALMRPPRLFFGTDEAALPPRAFEHAMPSPVERLRLTALPGGASEDGTSVAAKGVVTGEEATPKSPAERLALVGGARRKAEKCLADAIYFESRGETERGQVAVAQVVINRVFSGYYPEDVCGTVYQNSHRYLACQFTFACEGKQLIVNDQESWGRATRIAREMLDGKLWLNDVGKATHYHASWVNPTWVREMRKIQRIGVHTFYRPRKWEEEEEKS